MKILQFQRPFSNQRPAMIFKTNLRGDCFWRALTYARPKITAEVYELAQAAEGWGDTHPGTSLAECYRVLQKFGFKKIWDGTQLVNGRPAIRQDGFPAPRALERICGKHSAGVLLTTEHVLAWQGLAWIDHWDFTRKQQYSEWSGLPCQAFAAPGA